MLIVQMPNYKLHNWSNCANTANEIVTNNGGDL